MSEIQIHGSTVHQFTLAGGTRIELAEGFNGIRVFPDNGPSGFITETELRELAFGGLVIASHRTQDMLYLLAEHENFEPSSNATHWVLR